MIKGVVIKNLKRHDNDGGFFEEVMKKGEPGFHEIEQTSLSLTLPGVIKAFHYHDYPETWVVVKGEAKVVMHDIRENSPTKGETETVLAGENHPVAIRIPGGVAHGYKALGGEVVMLYHAGEAYDPKKEQIKTIPHDSKDINFNWE